MAAAILLSTAVYDLHCGGDDVRVWPTAFDLDHHTVISICVDSLPIQNYTTTV